MEKYTTPLIWQDSGGGWVISADDYRSLEEQLETAQEEVRHWKYDHQEASKELLARAERAEQDYERLRNSIAYGSNPPVGSAGYASSDLYPACEERRSVAVNVSASATPTNPPLTPDTYPAKERQ